MAKGGFPKSMAGGSMMKQQAQMQQKLLKMQRDLQSAQTEIEATLFTAAVGGNAVKAVANGKKELVEIVISPDAVDPEEVEMLQDMILSAVNDALRQADEAMSRSMNGISGGLNLGAFGLNI